MPADGPATLFSDPNCPFCYATEERLHRLGFADRVQWAGVQHAPHLATPMEPARGSLAAELPAEVAAIRRSAPDIEIAVPPGKPNTRAAIEHGAAALRTDPERGRAYVRALYRAFWQDGVDLSDPAALVALASDHGLPDLATEPTDVALADEWQSAWQATGLGGVPLIVRESGRGLYGLVDDAQIAAFFADG